MIANLIMQMLDEDNGIAEIQRNELAEQIGCVPSQINYVITSRFSPEQGYIVESRRGGGGYIKITRVSLDRRAALMHVVNNIGPELDEKTCRAHIYNLKYQDLLPDECAEMMLAAVSDNCYRDIPPNYRDRLRAAIFKQMLLTSMNF